MREFIKSHLKAVITLVLITATLLAYWPMLGHDFIIYYDDGEYVANNPHIQAGLTMKTVRWAFTAVRAANWHPLTWISHAADCGLYNTYPGGHHLTSLMIHAANVFLLFLLLSLMTGYYWRSALVAALFAVHPLHVESVAWVAERKDLLSTFFLLLTMLAYWRYAGKPSTGRYLPVFAAFALGLLSKPMLVTLPFVLLLLDYWPLGRKARWPSLVLEKIPLMVLAAASCVMTVIAQGTKNALGSLQEFSLGVRIANALVGYVTYLWKTVWPHNLALMYPHPGADLAMWKTAASAILLIGISLLVFSLRRKKPYLTVGWLWFLGMLVPVIGLVQVGGQAIADRYTYMPLTGIFIMVVWVVSDYARGKKAAMLAPAVGIAVLLVLGIVTRIQVGYWQDGETLFQHALDCTSDNYVMEDCLGRTLAGEGKFDEATVHYRAAMKIDPSYPPAHNNLGMVLAVQGGFDEGIREIREAIRLNPRFAVAHYNLAKALTLKGDVEQAITEYKEALSIRPDDANSHNNLGSIYAEQGRGKQAEDEFRAALHIDPSLVEAHTSLSSVLHKQDRLDEAIREIKIALNLDPQSAAAHYNLGVMLEEQHKLDDAIREYGQAVCLRTNLAPAYNNLAVIYYEKADYAQAWKEVELCRKYGGSPHPEFIRLLSEKMPPPGR